jgi:hypothetical protein
VNKPSQDRLQTCSLTILPTEDDPCYCTSEFMDYSWVEKTLLKIKDWNLRHLPPIRKDKPDRSEPREQPLSIYDGNPSGQEQEAPPSSILGSEKLVAEEGEESYSPNGYSNGRGHKHFIPQNDKQQREEGKKENVAKKYKDYGKGGGDEVEDEKSSKEPYNPYLPTTPSRS